jgi:hypothetical protein
MNDKLSDDEKQAALRDPASVFSEPQDVLDRAGLSDEERIEILRRWEYDAREMQVMEEESLPGREPGTTLDSVLAALHRLGAGPGTEQSPPTKQGGI